MKKRKLLQNADTGMSFLIDIDVFVDYKLRTCFRVINHFHSMLGDILEINSSCDVKTHLSLLPNLTYVF